VCGNAEKQTRSQGPPIQKNALIQKSNKKCLVFCRSGAVHVGDRILAINDILVKNKPVKEAYQLLDFSGELVKLRLQSVDTRRAKFPNGEKPPLGLDIPDMTSLHRVSAWAEIFNELDQIVASTPSTAKKGPGADTKAASNDGVSENVAKKTGNESSESEITATVCNDVESANDEFWEQFDELWEGDGSCKKTEQSVTNGVDTSAIRCHAASTKDEETASQDPSSGTIKGKSISIRYVVHEKCVNPTQETRERTTQRSCVYFKQDSRGKLTRDDSKSREEPTNGSCTNCTSESRETSTLESPGKLTQIAKFPERSPSVASGYETDNSTLRSSANDLPHCGRSSQADTEFFTSVDSFDISNDADDKLLSSPTKLANAQSSDVLETRTFSVQKSEEHGFGFSLMPDKFKQEVYIASVLPGGPCEGMLQPLDKITKVSMPRHKVVFRSETIQFSYERTPAGMLLN
jgi:hypothetical protein